MARTDEHFRLRLPSDMRDKLREMAERNRRSVTGEILFHLANALEDRVKAATGSSFQASPVAVTNETAFQGGPVTHGL